MLGCPVQNKLLQLTQPLLLSSSNTTWASIQLSCILVIKQYTESIKPTCNIVTCNKAIYQNTTWGASKYNCIKFVVSTEAYNWASGSSSNVSLLCTTFPWSMSGCYGKQKNVALFSFYFSCYSIQN